MNTGADPKKSSLVVSPSLKFSKPPQGFGAHPLMPGGIFFWSNDELIPPKDASQFEKFKKDHDTFFLTALETYSRYMVAHCALSIQVPLIVNSLLPKTTEIKHKVAPSIKKRIVFPDRRNSLWKGILKYFEPIIVSLPTQNRSELNDLTWALYLIILSSKSGFDTVLSIETQLNAVEKINALPNLSSEARARLSIIEGVFRQYGQKIQLPGFKVRATVPVGSIVERLNDILDDGYLLEASKLRRFIGLGSNIASIRRDLRSLTKFITKNCKWAKGMITATKYTSSIVPRGVLSLLSDLLPIQGDFSDGPMIIEPSDHFKNALGGGAGQVWELQRGIEGGYGVKIWR